MANQRRQRSPLTLRRWRLETLGEQMTLNEWKKLSPEEQAKRCRLDVSPYTDMDLFKEIEREFLREYGSEGTLYKVRCCFGPGLGPYNGIFVTLASSQKR